MSEPSGASSLASDSTTTFGLRLLYTVVGFATSVLITRGLGIEGRGLYYLPVVSAATIQAFGHLSLEQANVYLLGTRRISLDRLWGQSGLVAAGAGCLGLVGLVVAPTILPRLYEATLPRWIWLVALTIPFAIHTQFAAGLLSLRGDVTWQFRASLVASVVQLVLLAGFIVTGWFDVDIVLGVYLVVAVLTWAIIVSRLRMPKTSWLRWDRDLLRQTLRHSLWLHTGSVLLFLHFRLDMLMVQSLTGTAALGTYSLAVGLGETVLLATDSLAIAMLPRQVTRTIMDAARTALQGVRINFLLGSLLALGWAVAGYPVIVGAFGAQFKGAYLPLLSLLPGLVCLGLVRVCGGAVIRAGQPHRFVLINGVSLACNAGLNAWWIPLWGSVGAALASTVSYALSAFLFLYWTSRLAGTSGVAIIPGRADLAALRRGANAVLTRLRR